MGTFLPTHQRALRRTLMSIALSVGLIAGFVVPAGVATTSATAVVGGEAPVPQLDEGAASVDVGVTEPGATEPDAGETEGEAPGGDQGAPEVPAEPVDPGDPVMPEAPTTDGAESPSLQSDDQQIEHAPSMAPFAVGPMAAADSCSYADPDTGAYASTLCWINMEGLTTRYNVVSETVGSCAEESRWNFGTQYRYQCRASGNYVSQLGAIHGQTSASNAQGRWSAWGSQNASRSQGEDIARLAARSAAGTWSQSASSQLYGPVKDWPIEIQLSNTFTFRASVNISGNGGALAVNSHKFPTYSGATLGNGSFYTGVTGEPALYHAADAANSTSTISLSNVRVQPTGATGNQGKVSGFSIVVADAESTDSGESISWSYTGSDGYLWLPNKPADWLTANNDNQRKTAAVGNAYNGTNNNLWAVNSNTSVFRTGTTTVSANAQQQQGKSGTGMLQISPNSTSPNSTFTVTQAMKSTYKQGVAFGVVLAGAKVNVKVDDRILDANGIASTLNFSAQVQTPSYGTSVAQTGTDSKQGTSGEQSFPLSATGNMQLNFSATTPNDPTLSSYKTSWECFKSSPESTTRVAWPGNGGENPPAVNASWTRLNGGQSIECTVTYTPPYITLEKYVKPATSQDAPNTWTLKAVGINAPNSLVSGLSGSPAVLKRPIAIGKYGLAELGPADPLWTQGYSWTGLACEALSGSAPALTVEKDQHDIITGTPELTVSKGQNLKCNFTNTAGEAKLVVEKELFDSVGNAVNSGTALEAGKRYTYRITFDNRLGSAAKPIDHIDHLGDVLDDASYEATLRYGSVFGEAPVSGTPITPAGISASFDEPNLAIEGTVPAHSVRTMSFDVVLKANDVDTASRQGASTAPQGYLLRNYVTEEGEQAPASGCDADDSSCTEHPVRAWTVRKDSQPSDGAMIHVGGNIYYRVKITNFSGTDLTGVKVSDDMTETLSAALWDPGAPQAVAGHYGISYWTADNVHISTDAWEAATGPKPQFTCGTNCAFDPLFPNGRPFGNGTWKFETPPFNVPAEISGQKVAYAIVGYSVKGGWVADTTNPAEPYQHQGESVSAVPNAVWVNTVSALSGTISGEAVSANRCMAPVPPGDVPGFYDCKTWHSIGESYFHIWKKAADKSNGSSSVNNNLLGSTFLLADTKADAENGIPSRWLCRVNNNPWPPGSNPPAGITPRPSSDYVEPGSDPSISGAEDFGGGAAQAGSNTWRAIAAWNLGDQRVEKAQCGLFFHLDEESQGQAAGSWRALDVRGGSTQGEANPGSATPTEPLPDWRTASVPNVQGEPDRGRHGTYWLAEVKSPENYQLLAQPMELWVAPSSPTPAGLLPGNPALYDYQGRMSLPVVGHNEGPPPSNSGMGGGDQIRQMCTSGPYSLPGGNQPSCVMPTGWTMPVFDVRLSPLPLTGGIGTGWLVGGGAAGFAMIFGIAWWRRRKQSSSTH